MPLWFGRTSFSVPATGLLLVYLTVPTILVIIFSLNAALVAWAAYNRPDHGLVSGDRQPLRFR